MRSGRGSLTGTVASAVTKLDTLDAPAIRADSKDRTGIARDQRSRWTGRYEPARPSISASSAGAPSRACQSNINSDQDGLLERRSAQLYRSRSDLAFGRFGRPGGDQYRFELRQLYVARPKHAGSSAAMLERSKQCPSCHSACWSFFFSTRNWNVYGVTCRPSLGSLPVNSRSAYRGCDRMGHGGCLPSPL